MEAFEQAVLAKHPATRLGGDTDFCQAVSEIQGEFLTIHPFREGNARTIKLVTDLLAVQTGRKFLVYDQSEQGQDEYIAAARAAFRRDYGPLTAIIVAALNASR